MHPRQLTRAAAALLLTAAAWVGLSTAGPAQAATCSTGHGVSVVVDHHQLGGGVSTVCDGGGGGHYADRLFEDNGFALTYVQRQPGFVCRVNGAPSDDPCVNTPPADAYWGLWWSDGKSGSWTYSSVGVGSLKVPDGGYVALSWNGGDGKAQPGVTPTAHASPAPSSSPSASATQSPTPTPTRAPSSSPTGPSAPPQSTSTPSPTPSSAPATTATPTRTPSSSPSEHRRHHRQATPSPSASPSSSPTAAAVTSADPPDPTGTSGGLPGWVTPAVVVVLLGAAATAGVVRRRRTPA